MATKKASTKKAGTKKGGAAKKGAATKKGGGGTKKAGAKKGATKAGASTGKCTGWRAVQDSMPPGAPRLRVTGRCTFPTHGYKVTLREAVPQGINPRILLLQKIVRPPTGPVIQRPETVDVRFDKKNATTRYTNVTILPDGGTIKVTQVA
ncbi:MAG TPA: hypothetical protein VF525_11030 [Pyrinomonadaceae bacterium]|jgi:hypothetical protein